MNLIYDLYLKLIFLLSFAYTYTIRAIIGNVANINLNVSYVTTLTIIMFVLYNLKHLSIKYLWIVIPFIISSILSMLKYQISIKTEYKLFATILLPILFLLVNINKDKVIKFYEYFVKYFNIIIMLNTALIVLDFLSNNRIKNIIFDLAKIDTDRQFNYFRAYTLLGHPLTNIFYYLTYFSINMIYLSYFKKNDKKKSSIHIYLVTALGVLFSNGKMGIFVMVIMFFSSIVNFKGSKKIKAVLFIVLLMIFIINTSFFRENVLIRFTSGIENNQITSGRFSTFQIMKEYDMAKFNYFIGYGIGYCDYLYSVTLEKLTGGIGLEIPLLMFCYDIGIMNTVILYFFIGILPALIFLKNKTYYILLLYLCLFIYLNSYNGLAECIGLVQMIIFIEVVFINISNHINCKTSVFRR